MRRYLLFLAIAVPGCQATSPQPVEPLADSGVRFIKARVATPTAPRIDPSLAAYEQAKHDFDELDSNLGKQFEAWLRSDNPYLRQAALQRLVKAPELAPPSALDALLGLLDDRDPRPSGHCVSIVFRQRGDVISEGEQEDESLCRRQQRTNAALSLEVLQAARTGDRKACGRLLAFVDEKPGHGDALRELIRRACDHRDVLEALEKAKTPASTQAFLRSYLFFRVGAPHPYDVLTLQRLLKAPEQQTRGLAALAILLIQEKKGNEAATEEGLAVLDAMLRDQESGGVLEYVPAKTQGFERLGPMLVARLKHKEAGDPLGTITALCGLEPLPRGATQVLGGYLRGLWKDDVLQNTLRLEPNEARKLRRQVLYTGLHQDEEGKADLSLVLKALRHMGEPLSRSEFASLDRIYERDCDNEPTSYHDDPDEPWCGDAYDEMKASALVAGLPFDP